jgi:peptidoglycan/xylan/chitin deacetylase (PgdA/CDA1 family)
MAGRFILSFDCEGKWGIADHLRPEHDALLSGGRLTEAYGWIAALLAETEVPATFAFTELMLLDPAALAALPGAEIAARLPYTSAAFAEIAAGRFDGWSLPEVAALVADRHEIATHGVTHAPWGEIDAAQARFELSLTARAPGQTFIFPRNQVAHVEVLAEAGFTGYRLGPPPRSRAVSLLQEANLASRSEPVPSAAVPQPIPAGYFINWRSGPRRLVPPALTRARARRILNHAARTGGVAHFWTHPENIASAPGTLVNLRAVIEEAVKLRDAGRIEIQTQRDFVSALHGATSAEARPCAA